MRQQTETNHQLYVRTKPSAFHVATAGMYSEARKLADDGRIQSALNKACDLHIENYGHMRGTDFCIITTVKTVTMLGSWEDFE